MKDLSVTLIQSRIIWEEPEKNRKLFQAKIRTITETTNCIILPEMFTTGFTMKAEQFAEPPEGATLEWMRETAAQVGRDLAGSFIVKENGRFFNRLYWVKPDGRYFYYDKRHLFRMAQEDRVYRSGASLLTVEVAGWKVRPLICYDLRFPVWSRNRNNEYDVLIYVANWPKRRISHWRLLLKARAVENQAFAIGVNRVGPDGNGIEHTGDSLAVDPLGNVLLDMRDREGAETVRLPRQMLENYRQKFPVWKDSDNFEIVP